MPPCPPLYPVFRVSSGSSDALPVFRRIRISIRFNLPHSLHSAFWGIGSIVGVKKIRNPQRPELRMSV